MNDFFVKDLTIGQLTLSNVYLGDYRKFFNVKIKPFVLGYSKKVHVLDISYTLVQLRLLYKIIINIVSLRQRILVVKEMDPFQFSLIFCFIPKYIQYYNTRLVL